MRTFFLILAMILPIGAGATCTDTYPNPSPLMIEVRAAMLNGDYETFARRADAANRIAEAQKLNIINVLKGAHPNGFDFCEVLLRRELSDKLYQELSVFSEEGKDWVFLYALGARINGQETLLNFKFSNSATEELAKFR